jgi:hypothetical protein
MSLRTWFAICTVSYAVFGIALLVATVPFLSIYAVELNPGGILIARILGAALVGYTLIYWNLRSADAAGLRAVFLGSLVYNLIGIAISTNAVLTGLANAMGWTVVLLHLCLTAGFAYFLFGKPIVAAVPHG